MLEDIEDASLSILPLFPERPVYVPGLAQAVLPAWLPAGVVLPPVALSPLSAGLSRLPAVLFRLPDENVSLESDADDKKHHYPLLLC